MKKKLYYKIYVRPSYPNEVCSIKEKKISNDISVKLFY